jgi:hypothetical protein
MRVLQRTALPLPAWSIVQRASPSPPNVSVQKSFCVSADKKETAAANEQAPKPTPPTSAAAVATPSVLPGVMSAAAVALASFKFADVAGVALMSAQGITGGSPISGVPVAVIAGLVLNNALGPAMPPTIKPGLQLCLTTVLRAASCA